MPVSGSDMCLPALLGMEYPDPMGSGLSVPVLGCQTDLVSGIAIPLAGTMEDPDGKGIMKNKLFYRSLFTQYSLSNLLLNSIKQYRIKQVEPFSTSMLLHISGLVAIRYGSQTVDPVTGVLAPVVGARLEVSRKTVVPVTASYWQTVADQTDSVQVWK